MVLSDGTIKRYIDGGVIRIDPYEEEHVEPASVDLRLSDSFAKIESTGIIDTRDPDSVEYREFHTDKLVLNPGDTILGSTMERCASRRFLAHESLDARHLVESLSKYTRPQDLATPDLRETSRLKLATMAEIL